MLTDYIHIAFTTQNIMECTDIVCWYDMTEVNYITWWTIWTQN